MATRGQSGAKGFFFHVTHNKMDNKWHVKEVKAKDYETYDSRDQAIRVAKDKAKNVEQGHVVIHREDGKFEVVENF